MVEVFKTSVSEKKEAEEVLKQLYTEFPGSSINFDLEDCDRILRIESAFQVSAEKVSILLQKMNHSCEPLAD